MVTTEYHNPIKVRVQITSRYKYHKNTNNYSKWEKKTPFVSIVMYLNCTIIVLLKKT